MKRILCFVSMMAIAALFLISCGATKNQKLDGLWGLEYNPHDTISITANKSGNGGDMWYFGHPFTYTIKGSTMKVTTTARGNEYHFDIPFSFDGDDLILDLSDEAGFYSFTGKWKFIRLE